MRIDIDDQRRDLNRRIYARQLSRRGDRFGKFIRDIFFIKQHLALEIGQFDHVAIGDAQKPDSGAYQLVGDD